MAFPYSFLFVFLYGFIASIIGEIIAGLVQHKKARLLIKITVYGMFLSGFLFVAMETKFFAYLGIVAAILYVVIDEYLRKRTNLAFTDSHYNKGSVGNDHID
ncbi:hypothetical protein [Bacillus sp. E214]|uniref:hypothetical protein n=1 Tax=Bacillus sp. E214 TaxID=2587156 RepID=UPI0011E0652D|nr:hypothetical protein [Bacillus sp. E214]